MLYKNYMTQKIELELWENVCRDMKYPEEDNNNGYIYGINYLDDNNEIVDVTWFQTEEERNKTIEKEKLIILY